MLNFPSHSPFSPPLDLVRAIALIILTRVPARPSHKTLINLVQVCRPSFEQFPPCLNCIPPIPFFSDFRRPLFPVLILEVGIATCVTPTFHVCVPPQFTSLDVTSQPPNFALQFSVPLPGPLGHFSPFGPFFIVLRLAPGRTALWYTQSAGYAAS